MSEKMALRYDFYKKIPTIYLTTKINKKQEVIDWISIIFAIQYTSFNKQWNRSANYFKVFDK